MWICKCVKQNRKYAEIELYFDLLPKWMLSSILKYIFGYFSRCKNSDNKIASKVKYQIVQKKRYIVPNVLFVYFSHAAKHSFDNPDHFSSSTLFVIQSNLIALIKSSLGNRRWIRRIIGHIRVARSLNSTRHAEQVHSTLYHMYIRMYTFTYVHIRNVHCTH